MEIIIIDDIGEMEQNRWYETLDHCPSQCYYHTKRNGVDFVLYIRWRWDDPWEGHIIKNAFDKRTMHEKMAEWSGDLLGSSHYFEEDEYQKAQQVLLDIFNKLYPTPPPTPPEP